MYRWQAGNALRAMQHDLPLVQRSIAASSSASSREYSSSMQLRRDEGQRPSTPQTFPPSPTSSTNSSSSPRTDIDKANNQPTNRSPSQPQQSDTSMGLGSSSVVHNQQQNLPKFITADAVDTPVRITRQYRDFAPPSSSGPSPAATAAWTPAPSAPLNRRVLGSNSVPPCARGGGAGGAGRMLRATGGRGRGGRDRTRRRRDNNADMEEGGDSEHLKDAAAKIEAHLGPPPREWVDHVPEELSLEDLRVDWPSIPTGRTGMIMGVEEKLRWAARRIPHDYETPEDLAERLHRGQELVHFESAQEKEQVLQIARGLAERTADRITERTGKEVTPKESSFEGIREKDRVVLAREFVRGEYPPLEAGWKDMQTQTQKGKEGGRKRPAFLGDVMRILGNNETYHAKEQEQLMSTIQGLLATTPQRRVRAQAQAEEGA
ncbi:hypothetical protein EPUS_03306 [Endocarpon pusillum Z07020]|uniref:Uncharacterized protein n=1 Tax=Endocarpon pusillum (strain Z07020 / HMAS-L-300199) TaxID=1263415 RepID=U1GGW5_ENDPU|nr:uncharacterized protein EPUS_03306 [Endocarpon pusillum Z07020]ERF71026.1 hypothetical protein EPUS_03306 [Endocarpon pusillum Z07020]